MTGLSQAVDTLERWSSTIFLLAGGVWIIDTAPYALDLFINISMPDALNAALMLAAFLLTVIGVFGFYPPLANQTPRLARVGALLIAMSMVLILGSFGWIVGVGLFGLAMPPGALLVVIITFTLLALIVFGAASVLAATPSQTCGVLVLALAATWIVWIAGILGVLAPTPAWASIVLGILFAVLTVSIGVAIRFGATPLHRRAPAGDPTPK